MTGQYYFAYGSNLSNIQMAERGVSFKSTYLGMLKDFRLTFDYYSKRWNGGAADIVPSEGDWVEGVLYEVSAGLENLDKFEGVPKGVYQRIRVPVVAVEFGLVIEAFTYEIIEKQGFVQPSDRYVSIIQTNGMQQGFDSDYLKFIQLAAADRVRLAVYGTLKHGQQRHMFLERDDIEFQGTREISGYALYMTPFGYPAVVDIEDPEAEKQNLVPEGALGPVRCELYELPRAVLEELDTIEGYPELFRRLRVGEAYIYVWNQPVDERFRCIPEGVWPVIRKVGKKIIRRR